MWARERGSTLCAWRACLSRSGRWMICYSWTCNTSQLGQIMRNLCWADTRVPTSNSWIMNIYWIFNLMALALGNTCKCPKSKTHLTFMIRTANLYSIMKVITIFSMVFQAKSSCTLGAFGMSRSSQGEISHCLDFLVVWLCMVAACLENVY